MRVSAARMRAAVIRVVAGKSTEKAEADRLGVHKSTLSRAVGKYADEMERKPPLPDFKGPLKPEDKVQDKPTEPQPAPQPQPPQPAQIPEVVGKVPQGVPRLEGTPLERAQQGAGTGPTKEQVQEAVRTASNDDIEFCMKAILQIKQAGAAVLGSLLSVAGDPMKMECVEISPLMAGAIAQNATWLRPKLEKTSGPEAFAAVAMLEAIVFGFALWGARTVLRKKPADETEVDE